MPELTEDPEWKALKAGPFMDAIGPVMRQRTPDRGNLYGLRAEQNHCNAIGTVHGGVLTSLLDQVIAIEAWNAADRQPTVTLQMDTRFIGAARAGDLLEARATLRHATRTMLFVDAELMCDGRAVALATAVMKIVAQKDKT